MTFEIRIHGFVNFSWFMHENNQLRISWKCHDSCEHHEIWNLKCFHGHEKWIHAFFNTFSWDFHEKEIHGGVTEKIKKLTLRPPLSAYVILAITYIVPSYGMYFQESLLIVIL